MNLINDIIEKAKKNKINLGVADAIDSRALRGAEFCLKNEICNITLIGNKEKITKIAQENSIDISKAIIIDPKTSEKTSQYAQQLYISRKDKGLTLQQAEELVKDDNYFGSLLAINNEIDAFVGSAICSTGNFLKPVLQIIRINKPASYVMLLKKDDRYFFCADICMNIQPNLEMLANIAINTADYAKLFGFDPKVALISFSTKDTNSEQVEPILESLKIAKQKRPDLKIDGEFQIDAATDPESCQKKAPDSNIIKGDANCLIFPNITSANIFYHSMTKLGGFELIFGTLIGSNKPASLLLRTSPQTTVNNTMAACTMLAGKE